MSRLGLTTVKRRKSKESKVAAQKEKELQAIEKEKNAKENAVKLIKKEPITIYQEDAIHGVNTTETYNLCQWPHGEPTTTDFYFCHKEIIAGRPYCQEHSDIAYRDNS